MVGKKTSGAGNSEYDHSFRSIKKNKKDSKGKKNQSATNKTTIIQLKQLLDSFPGEPKFVGKIPVYKKGMMDRLFNTGDYSRIKSLRAKISRHAERKVDLYNKKDALDLRKKWLELDKSLKKIVNRYNHVPDLHALAALHQYSDSKFVFDIEKRFPLLRESVIEMATALHNQAVSIFNVIWFIGIYLDYLQVYKKLVNNTIKSTAKDDNKQVQQLINQLKQKTLQLDVLSNIVEKQDGVILLNQKLRNSAYVTDGTSTMEIKRASNAIKNDDPKLVVGEGKVANFTIAVVVITTLALTRIPILKNLVHDLLSAISDGSRELRLQKRMIITADMISDFDLAVAGGDRKSKTKTGNQIYHYCLKTIKLYWQNASLIKPYEIDPFMKLAWITIETKGLYDTSSYQKMLEQCIKFLEIVISQAEQKSDTIQYGKLLLFSINSLESEFSS
ncbi:MAG: hypothetical protein GY786_09195 [Proteobacteria bacterium]|nr:hypothetical protein [Pseudomonadota bacterium]